MAFYQGSLEGCNPAPPPAQLPLTQGRFSSRAHFPKCTCFKSKMSDISETNNPRFCFFIFTESHLQDCGSGCNKRCLSALVLIDIVDTVAFCVLTIKLLNVTELHELDFFFKRIWKMCRNAKIQNWLRWKEKLCPEASGLLIPTCRLNKKSFNSTSLLKHKYKQTHH